MDIFVIILFISSLLYLFLFSLSQLHLTWIYLRKKKPDDVSNLDEEPFVTIQLPIYNEKYVIERLIDAIAKLDYPKEKLQIQILDDSTDETTGIIYQKLTWLGAAASHMQHIHRKVRTGFKAGALQNGLMTAKGDFIAIFDADFLPPKDFLRKTLPYFNVSSIGAVQTRWGHINKDYSILTQLQAFALDAHFSIEQTARNTAGSFINFNGTCGIWRKQCITDAGGWSDDTITEDLDLSYRAQIRGWKFKYLEDVATPGELPVIMPVIKSQQYRWNKGAAENARKNFLSVLRTDVPLRTKVHAFFHLFNSSVFLAVLVAGVTSLPMLYLKNEHPVIQTIFRLGIILLAGFLSVAFFYWISTRRFNKHPFITFVTLFPSFLVMSMGLSLHNGLAVMEGLLGIKTPFVRTPKFNITSKRDKWIDNSYLKLNISMMTLLEGVLCLYFLFALGTDMRSEDSSLAIFHLMMSLGFGLVFYFTIKPMTNA